MVTNNFLILKHFLTLIPKAKTLRMKPKFAIQTLHHHKAIVKLTTKTSLFPFQQSFLPSLLELREKRKISSDKLVSVIDGFSRVSEHHANSVPNGVIGRNLVEKQVS